MKGDSYKEIAAMFKALTNETRLRIIEMICQDEICACKILESFNITQPTLSYHMKVLRTCGLVDSRQEGSSIKYFVNREKIESIKRSLVF